MVGIADRKGFRQRKLIGQIRPPVMTHGELSLELGPEAEFALIPSGLGIVEGMRRSRHSHRAGGGGIKMIGRDFASAIGLKPHWLAVLKWYGMAIPEPPYPPQCSEVMIKGSVLHHQNDDVLYILD